MADRLVGGVSASSEDGGAPEVVDGGEGEEVCGVAFEGEASGLGLAVETLHGAKDRLDGGAALGDEAVAPGHPGGSTRM